jgi:uncharacterized protein YbjT (DUF2867 family)
MSLHVVVGAGPVGSATARLLAAKGEQVRLITPGGSGPQRLVDGPATRGDEGIECVAADASDGVALSRYAEGAVALYCCAGPGL